MLQRTSFIQPPNPLLPILIPPIRQQQPRQHGINPQLRALRGRNTLHQMQLRSLRDRIRHTAPPQALRRNTARNNHHTPFVILLEIRHGFLHVLLRPHDLRRPAAVPFVVGHAVQVREVGEARPAGVGDDDVDAAEGRDGFAYAAFTVVHYGAVAL